MNTHSLNRRQTLALGAAAAIAPLSAWAKPSPMVLVELFTSQGCSSCPPADELAADLVKDPNIIVASFNVDYWDYLGWRDTLAKPEYTQRQYDYAKSRNDNSVYTPQMVFNGQTHTVGSNRHNVLQQINSQRKTTFATNINLQQSKHKIEVDIAAAEFSGEATLWLMAVEPQVVQKIARGENTGKDVTYVNVVRNLVPAAMWTGEAYTGSWMRDAIMTKGTTQLIAVLQQDKVGPVLALAKS